MSVALRPMCPADVPELVRLASQIMPFPWDAATFESCFAAGYKGWVLALQGALIGFWVGLVEAKTGQLLNIGVARSFWRQGWGRYLLEHFLSVMQQKAAEEVWLEVRASNTAAIAVYQQVGFVPIATRKAYYPAVSGREEAIVMQLSGWARPRRR